VVQGQAEHPCVHTHSTASVSFSDGSRTSNRCRGARRPKASLRNDTSAHSRLQILSAVGSACDNAMLLDYLTTLRTKGAYGGARPPGGRAGGKVVFCTSTAAESSFRAAAASMLAGPGRGVCEDDGMRHGNLQSGPGGSRRCEIVLRMRLDNHRHLHPAAHSACFVVLHADYYI
jgi:hypothetical protein